MERLCKGKKIKSHCTLPANQNENLSLKNTANYLHAKTVLLLPTTVIKNPDEFLLFWCE